jgi:hypothetical protein
MLRPAQNHFLNRFRVTGYVTPSLTFCRCCRIEPTHKLYGRGNTIVPTPERGNYKSLFLECKNELIALSFGH